MPEKPGSPNESVARPAEHSRGAWRLCAPLPEPDEDYWDWLDRWADRPDLHADRSLQNYYCAKRAWTALKLCPGHERHLRWILDNNGRRRRTLLAELGRVDNLATLLELAYRICLDAEFSTPLLRTTEAVRYVRDVRLGRRVP